MLKTALAYLAYPALTSSLTGFGLWAVGRGWPSWAVGVTAITVATVVTAGLERVIPYSKAWATPRNDRLTDVLHMCISNRAFDVGTMLTLLACGPLRDRLASWVGAPLWPSGWPLLLQGLLAIVVFELPWYWLHRLGHESAICWRVHSVHHSSRRIYWWNFSRNHPLDNLVSAIAASAPLVLLGTPDAALAVMASFSAAHGLMQHSNIDLRTGFLDYFLSTARVHRWHHSPDPRESNANYSPRLMLWDHVFGTFRFEPDRAPPEEVGLGPGGERFPEGFVEQMKVPFRGGYWRRSP